MSQVDLVKWSARFRELLNSRSSAIDPPLVWATGVETTLALICGILIVLVFPMIVGKPLRLRSTVLWILLAGVVPFLGLALKIAILPHIRVLPFRYVDILEWSVSPWPALWMGIVIGMLIRLIGPTKKVIQAVAARQAG